MSSQPLGSNAPERVRVLLIDDSAFVRRSVGRLLAEAGLTVVGPARNAAAATALLQTRMVDIVVLDVDSPHGASLSALRAIQKQSPSLPVIVFGEALRPGAAATLEALLVGACDYVHKPSGNEAVLAVARTQLLPKVAQHARAAGAVGAPERTDGERPGTLTESPAAESPHIETASTAATPSLAAATRGTIRLVVVGVSTGGPQTLLALLSAMPARFPVPIVIVQHMLPAFLPPLAERLSARTPLAVRIAEENAALHESPCWLAPGGRHLRLTGSAEHPRLALDDGPPVNSCRPAADCLFRSAADVFGPGVLGVVLTGMGRDGTTGAEAIVAAGGEVFAQDEASSVVDGMPRSVRRAGLASRVLSLDEFPTALIDRVAQ